MKPLVLKIAGINSFNDEQVINFQKLYGKGLFGIFGPTGSGKSSIIDAITLALYGKISRYDGRNGTKEFVNINKDDFKARVYFEFCINSSGEYKTYSVERRFKKDDKGTPKTILARLSYLQNSTVEILSEKASEVSAKLEYIIGLRYEDFIRAVVLPQGKFSEFLMLENKEKRTMLERIFMLEKYGQSFTDKVNEKKAIQEKKFTRIEEVLNELENVNEESITELENELTLKSIQLENILKEVEEFDKKCYELNEIIHLKEDLLGYIDKKNELTSYTKVVKDMEKKLEKARKFDLIKDFLYDLRKVKESLNEEKNIYENLKENWENVSYEYNQISEKYQVFKEDREANLPKLTEAKAKLERAIKIKNDTDKIEVEIKQKTEKLLVCEKKLESFKLEIEEINREKGEYLAEVEEVNFFIKNNKIKSDFKAKVEQAVKLEENYKAMEQDIFQKNARIELINLQCANLYEEKISLEDEISNLQREIETFKEDLLKLKADLASCQQEITRINSQILLNENEYKNLCEQKIILDELSENKKSIQIKLSEISEEEVKFNEKFKHLNEKLLEISFLYNENNESNIVFKIAQKLVTGEACPVCGSKQHPSPRKEIEENILEILELEKKNLELELEKVRSENEKILNEKVKLETELKSLNLHIIKLEDLLLENSISERKIALENSKVRLSQLNDDEKNLQNKIDENFKLLENAEDKLNLAKIKFSEVSINIKNNEENLYILNDELSKINLDEVTYLIMKIKSDTGVEKFLDVYDEIKTKEKLLEDKEAKRLDLDEKLAGLSLKLEQNKSYMQNLEMEIITLKTSISENLFYKEKMLQDLDYIDFSGDFTLEIQLESTVSKINELEKEYKILTEDKLKIEEKRLDLEKKYYNSLNKVNILTESKENKESEFNQKLIENGFFNSEEAEQSFLSYERQNAFNEKIRSFNEKMQSYIIWIEKITKTLAEKNFGDLDLSEVKEKLEEEKEKLKNLKLDEKSRIEEITALKINLNDLRANLDRKAKLMENFGEELYKLDLLKELSNLVKGGVFVEHMAINQLKQIIIEAGQRLKLMTNNKFSIELNNSEFVIKDYHNGGVNRSIKSLSGGELFMASLSLAIALSSKIQLTNEAPLEFMFLDEGFGSLDSFTLDTVIQYLEKLQTQNLNVGIITHIEEVKNRINSRILVSKDDRNLGTILRIQ